jgi:hypothetical protein
MSPRTKLQGSLLLHLLRHLQTPTWAGPMPWAQESLGHNFAGMGFLFHTHPSSVPLVVS